MILEKEICVTVDFLFCFLKSCSSLQSPLTVKVKTRIMNYKIDNAIRYTVKCCHCLRWMMKIKEAVCGTM